MTLYAPPAELLTSEAELLTAPGLARWRAYLEFELRRRESTVKAYMSALRRFGEFYAETDGPPLAGRAARRTLREYLQWLSRPPREYDSGTVHFYFRALSSWFEWQIVEELRDTNPVRGLRLPDYEDPERDLLNRDQVRALFAAADRVSRPWDPHQARSILSLLVGNALRAGEIQQVQLGDLDLSELRLTVRPYQKSKRESILPVVRPFDEYHRVWLKRRAELFRSGRRRDQTEQLCCFGPHRELGDDGVYALLDQLLRLAHLRKQLPHVTPHAFRHYAIDTWNEIGGLEEARRLARHASVMTTSRYVHPTSPRLRAIAGGVGESLFPDQAVPTPEELAWRALQPSLPFDWE